MKHNITWRKKAWGPCRHRPCPARGRPRRTPCRQASSPRSRPFSLFVELCCLSLYVLLICVCCMYLWLALFTYVIVICLLSRPFCLCVCSCALRCSCCSVIVALSSAPSTGLRPQEPVCCFYCLLICLTCVCLL